MRKFLFILFISIQAGAQTPASSLADSLFAIGKYAEAISTYKKVEHKTSPVYFKMARAYRTRGNFGKALKTSNVQQENLRQTF